VAGDNRRNPVPQEPRIVKGVNRYFSMLGWLVLIVLALWMYRSCMG
jgi:hypothetical protein